LFNEGEPCDARIDLDGRGSWEEETTSGREGKTGGEHTWKREVGSCTQASSGKASQLGKEATSSMDCVECSASRAALPTHLLYKYSAARALGALGTNK